MTCSHNKSARSFGKAVGRRLSAALLLSAFMASASAEPYVPTSDDVVLETLPPRAVTAAFSPESASSTHAVAQSLGTAIAKATSHLTAARSTGDPRHLGYAQAALGPWWKADDAPVTIGLLRAEIHQHNHDFVAALAQLSKVLAKDPRNAQAMLTRAAIHQVQGKYVAAEADCRRLVLVASPLTTAECLSRVSSLRGHARAAYKGLVSLRDRHPTLDATERREIELTLADISARLGIPSAARSHYAAALDAGAPDAYTLAAFADFLLDQRDFAAVLELTRKYPLHSDLSVRAALASRASRMPGASALAAQLRAQYAAHKLRGDFTATRDYARFLLDIEADAPAALEAALGNWLTQRESADARIVLRAAIAAHRPQAAAPVISFLTDSGLEDVQLEPLIAQLRSKS